MARHGVRWLRVAGGVVFVAVALVTAITTAIELRASFSLCDPNLLVLCAIPMPPPPPDWTPVVALGAVGIVLLWPRRRRTADEPAR